MAFGMEQRSTSAKFQPGIAKIPETVELSGKSVQSTAYEPSRSLRPVGPPTLLPARRSEKSQRDERAASLLLAICRLRPTSTGQYPAGQLCASMQWGSAGKRVLFAARSSYLRSPVLYDTYREQRLGW